MQATRLRAPIWADRAAAKPFSGERVTLDLRGNRRHPLKGNQRRSVRQRLHEMSGLRGVAPFDPHQGPAALGSRSGRVPQKRELGRRRDADVGFYANTGRSVDPRWTSAHSHKRTKGPVLAVRNLPKSAVRKTPLNPFKPDAGNPHVRFDERGEETERCRIAQATAPLLDSTSDPASATWRLQPYRPFPPSVSGLT